MLRELSIKNFAIIDDLSVRFSKGLTIFSGETGAGKSIIINAINLLLGGRANAGIIRSGADSAELEALFEIAPDSPAARRLARHGYPDSRELLIRRTISRKERHRIYLNGRLSTIQVLGSITENLASISGQHAHQGLLKTEQHLLILDRYSGLMPLRSKVQDIFHRMVPLIERLQKLRADMERHEQRMELLQFQQNEILAASLEPGEDSELEREKIRLQNARFLQETVLGSLEALYSSRGAAVEQLISVQKDIAAASSKDSELRDAADRISDVVHELEDVVDGLRDYADRLVIDAQRMEAVEERLDLLHRLKRKYGGSLDAVLAHLKSIDKTLEGADETSFQVEETEKQLLLLRRELIEKSRQLSAERAAHADMLSAKVIDELASLKMTPARFQVDLQTAPAGSSVVDYFNDNGVAISDTGVDRASFLFSPNVGEECKPLAAIASGGELSRVVLALKAILAESDAVQTVVFDEVDDGIGGGVAETVGRKLSILSRRHQIICITHLAQIARFGDHHFRISKQVVKGRTQTRIHSIRRKEARVEEIARMLGGEKITPTTLDHAKELLENASPVAGVGKSPTS